MSYTNTEDLRRIATLRAAIRELVNGLGNGSCIASDASDEFHALGCREVASEIGRLRARLTDAEHARDRHATSNAALRCLLDASEAEEHRARDARDAAEARAVAAEGKLAEGKLAEVETREKGAVYRLGVLHSMSREDGDEHWHTGLNAEAACTMDAVHRLRSERDTARTQLAEMRSTLDRTNAKLDEAMSERAAINEAAIGWVDNDGLVGAVRALREDCMRTRAEVEAAVKRLAEVEAEAASWRSTLGPLVREYERCCEHIAGGEGHHYAIVRKRAIAIADAAVRLLGTGGGE